MAKAVKRILHEMITDERGLSWLAILAILLILGAGYLTVKGVSTGLYDLVTSAGKRTTAVSKGIADSKDTNWSEILKDYRDGTLEQTQALGKTVLSADTSTSPGHFAEGESYGQEFVERIEKWAQQGIEKWGCRIYISGVEATSKGSGGSATIFYEDMVPEYATIKLTEYEYSAKWKNAYPEDRASGSDGEVYIKFDSNKNIVRLEWDKISYPENVPIRKKIDCGKMPLVLKPECSRYHPVCVEWKLSGADLEDRLLLEKYQIYFPPNSDHDEQKGRIEELHNYFCDDGSSLRIFLYPVQ